MKPVDWVVLSMAVTVCAVVFIQPLKYIVFGESISPETAKLVAGIITSMLAVISMYVGSKIRHRNDDED